MNGACHLCCDGGVGLAAQIRVVTILRYVTLELVAEAGLYFAYLYVEKDRNGTGHWNEEPGAGHAHTPLGPLTRDGACWKSDTVKLCAW